MIQKEIIMDENINTLTNPKAYGPLSDIAKKPKFTLYTKNINKDNWQEYYDGLLNIFKDGIYSKYVHQYMMDIVFTDDEKFKLTITDFYINLVLWRMIIELDYKIESKHLFWVEEITQNAIKDFIDNFISENRTKKNTGALCRIIADSLHYLHDVDMFSDYLSNTLNLRDTIILEKKSDEYRRCLHSGDEFKNMPIDKIREYIMSLGNKSIDIIKDSKDLMGYDHCLADIFRADQGMNKKQYCEVSIGVGVKPDGQGDVFNIPITNSFLNGGMKNPKYYFMESSVGRIAQIIKFKNVSKSGAFARILGLNNMSSFLHPDETYDCGSRNYVELVVKNNKYLKLLNLRYYKESPNGVEKILDSRTDKHLIGKKIYLRDPCTCASFARGEGVCYKCYGNLAYSVFDSYYHMGVNIGRIASEYITSKFTQKQLSVKHILDAIIKEINLNDDFYSFFELEIDSVIINRNIENNKLKKLKIIINPEDIELENESEDVGDFDGSSGNMYYSEYITKFDVLDTTKGKTYHIQTENEIKLYITNELNGRIKKYGEPVDKNIVIGFNEVKSDPIFIAETENNEITKSLRDIKNHYNKISDVKNKSINQLLQEILDIAIESKMGISAIHYSILLSNQIRSDKNVLETPDWSCINPGYQILTLDEALMQSPYALISLMYQKISKQFRTPLTYKKTGASFIDLFFMERPQDVIRDSLPVVDEDNKDDIINPIRIVEDPNSITGINN